eukprot:1157807-Pelagomonas_calceolata.AAC.5
MQSVSRERPPAQPSTSKERAGPTLPQKASALQLKCIQGADIQMQENKGVDEAHNTWSPSFTTWSHQPLCKAGIQPQASQKERK